MGKKFQQFLIIYSLLILLAIVFLFLIHVGLTMKETPPTGFVVNHQTTLSAELKAEEIGTVIIETEQTPEVVYTYTEEKTSDTTSEETEEALTPLEEFEQDYDYYEDRYDYFDDELDDIKDDLNDEQGDLEELNELKDELENLEDDVKDLEDDIKDLLDDVDDYEDDHATSEDRKYYADLEDELDDLLDDIEEILDKIQAEIDDINKLNDEQTIPDNGNETIPNNETENNETIYDFYDDFETYTITGDCLDGGDTIGDWNIIYAGYGCVEINTDGSTQVLQQEPMTSTNLSETHAAMVIGPEFSNSLTYELKVYTDTQLRQNDPANEWEVAWVLWHYTDDDHFYYFIPKPNGWELGKEDPNYNGSQRFLATGSNILFPIQQWYDIKIEHDITTNTMTVYVDEQLIVEFTDTETPYTSGNIGLYNEDARVFFDDLRVTLN
jgi:predicted  nucleic acid-binding Zn-ribbon protein